MTTAFKKNFVRVNKYKLLFWLWTGIFQCCFDTIHIDVYIRWSRKKYPLLVDIFVHNLVICGHRYSGYQNWILYLIGGNDKGTRIVCLYTIIIQWEFLYIALLFTCSKDNDCMNNTNFKFINNTLEIISGRLNQIQIPVCSSNNKFIDYSKTSRLKVISINNFSFTVQSHSSKCLRYPDLNRPHDHS